MEARADRRTAVRAELWCREGDASELLHGNTGNAAASKVSTRVGW